MTQICLLVQAIAAHVQQRPELLPQLLTTLFELVLFEECNNQWSLSRPMLSLILVNEQIYNELRHRIIASQPVSSYMTGPGKWACKNACARRITCSKLYPQYGSRNSQMHLVDSCPLFVEFKQGMIHCMLYLKQSNM